MSVVRAGCHYDVAVDISRWEELYCSAGWRLNRVRLYLTRVFSKQPVPHLHLRLVFLRNLFQKSIVIIFLCKDSLAQVLGKYAVTETSGLTPIHRRERCPSSQVLLFAVTNPSTILKHRQSSQMEKISCSQASSFRHFCSQRFVLFFFFPLVEDLWLAWEGSTSDGVVPYLSTLLRQATLSNPTSPWRKVFLSLSPLPDPLLLSPSSITQSQLMKSVSFPFSQLCVF